MNKGTDIVQDSTSKEFNGIPLSYNTTENYNSEYTTDYNSEYTTDYNSEYTTNYNNEYTNIVNEFVPEIYQNANDEFLKKQNVLDEDALIEPNNDRLDIPKIIDKPENMIMYKFMSKENNYHLAESERFQNKIKKESLEKLRHVQTDSIDVEIFKKKNKKNKKCYTCFPRRKIIEHIILDTGICQFHHDICNRNMLIITPVRHFSNLSEALPNEISLIFHDISNFCVNWNIIDYSITFNQGDWQSHTHFHIKLKTHENTIKRMRGDHFRLVKLQKEYNSNQLFNE
jgi:hypothetical protein